MNRLVHGYVSPSAKIERNLALVDMYDKIKNFAEVARQFEISVTSARSIYATWAKRKRVIKQ